ncbi:molybdenum cofactor sulfurase [Polymorphobacter glacialis]|uniref:Molybdenum cofactor sulfurase n=1 Tax=Sandarakinorhabdus glacialis TaxID=1614636 RepID=A0A917E4J7_9SPHN|nr:MOSC domain-containing protein [Polymorphobacter glacialis]GGE00793.1 molybdenum cofactor sulfurase [Polymorphobacter glacialis]
MTAPGIIQAIHVGRTAPLRGNGQLAAFIKTPVTGSVAIHSLGIAGDEQTHRRVHGGPDKAVYAYALSDYVGWRAEFPEIADRFGPGSMGENLVVTGLDETSVHIGDIIRCGTALLQVSQIREPCAILADVMGTAKVVRAMVRSGRCGWYFRVLEPGSVAAGDPHTIIERPNPSWPISRFTPFAAGKGGTVEALQELTTLPGLTRYWRTKAEKALAAQSAPLTDVSSRA